ncbi:MAG: PAS domain S-box protein [Proteobacteria bacterium]|nr:PAS domain S-box protein [Pseudomonadota bacterium]
MSESDDERPAAAAWQPALAALTEHLQDTVLVTNAAGRIRAAYGSYASTGGWKLEDVIGASVTKFIHPLDLATALGRLMLNVADPSLSGQHRLEVRALRADGTYRATEAMLANRLADPAIRGIVITVRDIGPRREAELGRAESEERFRVVTDLSGDMIAMVGADGSIRYYSESCERILGYPPGTRIGRPLFDKIVAEDQPRARAAFRELVSQPLASRQMFEVRIHHVDGGVRWVQALAVNLLGHPAVGCVVFSARDITERKESELALADARARLDAALWGAHVGLYAVDLATDRAELSPHFFEITGILRSEWEADPNPWDARIHPRDRRMVAERVKAHLAGEQPIFEAEYRLRTPRGWLWILDRARVMQRDPDGRPRTLCGTVMDVSARKQLERELVETTAREQQRLSQDLHDGLGQELTGIALLMRSAAKRLDGGRQGVGADVETAIDHLNRAIRNARALAHGLHPVRADEGGLAGALESLAANARPGDVGIAVDTRRWGGQALPGDVADHAYRIVQEALANALRHAQASQVTIRLAAEPEAVVVAVRDNGIGLGGVARAAPGLGRRIIAHRAQLIGGSVEWLEPGGGGTEVVLTVPWAAAIAAGAAAEVSSRGRP